MNIVIFTGSFGNGHNEVAKAVAEEIKRKHPLAQIEIVDFVKVLLPIDKQIYFGFNTIVKKWSAVYNLMNRFAQLDTFKPIDLFKKQAMKELRKLFIRLSPSIVICTAPFCVKYVSDYKKEFDHNLKLFTFVTDLCFHREWVSTNTDAYFVGSKKTKVALNMNGVPMDSIYVTGIPVKQVFKDYGKKNKYKIEEKKKILVLGGGLGLIPATQEFLNYFNGSDNYELTIITGHNVELKENLEKSYENINVIAYTENIIDYMKEATVIFTKAGGITLFESIYVGAPLFVTRPLLEQEKANCKYVEEMGIGQVLWNKNADVLGEFLQFVENDKKLEAMAHKMEVLKEEFMSLDFVPIMEMYRGMRYVEV